MTSLNLILASAGILAACGLPAFLFPFSRRTGPRISAGLIGAGSLTGFAGLAMFLHGGMPAEIRLPWFLPWGGFFVAVDSLSAVFIGLILLVPALGSLYGIGYGKNSGHAAGTGARLDFFYGLLAGSMVLVVIARDAVLFLIAWEIMAVSAFFCAAAEDANPDVRRAGWIYLVATHIGTLCLFAMFALWKRATGSFGLDVFPAGAEYAAGAVFVLALIGFGFKAGFMPLHVWLPGAHANAPSHVSAVMSGVMLKMGIYGLLRITSLLPAGPAWWGSTLLVAGAVSGVAGIILALGQHDIKKLLAYSSIENMGIIAMGLGLALLGRTAGRWDFVLLGLGGALFHVLNHGLFKPLLFFNAGAVIHAVRTRDMDRLGGLAGRMPKTAVLFAIGAAAICALPPLNGFAGELLLYLGFFRALGGGEAAGFPLAAAAAALLAMIGALAAAAFVKVFAVVFLGSARTSPAGSAHDPETGMLFPSAVLAGLCAAIGIFPMVVLPLLERAVRVWAGASQGSAVLSGIAPLWIVTLAGAGLTAITVLLLMIGKSLPRAGLPARSGTWDCGYAEPTARMQYTGSSFARSIVELFSFFLRPGKSGVPVSGSFPRVAFFKSVVLDPVLEGLLLPFFKRMGRHLPKFFVLQHGQTHYYVLYIFVIVIVLLFFGRVGFIS